MPYRSRKQRSWMHINLPAIAAEWDRKYGTKIIKSPKKKPRAKRRRMQR